jgi:iron complex transport system permease protein
VTTPAWYRVGRWYAIFCVALIVAVLVGLVVGEVSIPPAEAWRAFLGRFGLGEGSDVEAVFWSIRMPRIVAGVLVGAALGAAGAALQGVYRNPMADPYLLGISSAAGLGVVVGIALTPAGGVPVLTMAVAAAAGAAFTLFTRRVSRVTVDPARFILVGVALGIALLAWTVMFVFIWDSPRLPTFAYFVFGSLGAITWKAVWGALPFLLGGLALVAIFTRELDLLALGDREARHLGVSVRRVVAAVLAGAGIAVGASVGLAGVIGFVGLLAPFVVRRWVGPSHRNLLPASALVGATAVVAADVLARLVAGPVEVPIGIVTAAFGGPILVWMLVRTRGTTT